MKPLIILSFVLTGLFSCNNARENPTEQTSTGKVSYNETTAPKKTPEVIDGESLEFYENGKVKFRGMMKNGKRDGLWSSYYENGAKWSETTFAEGKKNGKTTTWYENSQMRYDGFYTNDMESGKWIFWDEKGKQVETKDYDKK